MNISVNIISNTKDIGSFMLTCCDCGKTAEFKVVRLNAALGIKAFPVKSLHNRYLAVCNLCGAAYYVNSQKGDALRKGKEVYITSEAP